MHWSWCRMRVVANYDTIPLDKVAKAAGTVVGGSG